MVEPLVPNGAQKELQQPVQPEQTRPSTAQPLLTVAQVPAVVAVAPVQIPVQQALPLKQMSPAWVQ